MKKIILSAFFAAALLSNLFFIPTVSAAETEFFNCSKETLVTPETAENTCFRLYPSLPTVKRLAPDSKCNNTGWTNGNVCCCESKIDYSCSWREIKTTTTCGGPGACVTSVSGGCLSGEAKGGDCNAGVRPKDGAYKTYDCCCPAKTYATQKAKFTMPDWQVRIDTITLSAAKCTGPDNTGECEIPWIAEYIQGMYKYGLGIGGILAAIMLMAGGVLWLVSAGDVSRITQAKDLIIGSITGLMILMGSYILLSQINPELLNLRPISIKMIDQILLEPGNESPEDASSPFFQCVHEKYGSTAAEVEKNLTTVNFLGMNYRVNKQMAVALTTAQSQVNATGITYKSTDQAGGGYNWRANVNNPTQQSLHSFGIAIDINPTNNPNYKSTERPCKTDIPETIIIILKANGFRWGGDYRTVCDSMHFEWVTMNAPCKIK